MDNITKLMEQVTLNSFDIGKSYWVNITHINNPHSFYVRPIVYMPYLENISQHGEPLDASKIELQATVVYYSKALCNFVRGKIVYIDDNDSELKCDIFTPDFGVIERAVPLTSIMELTTDIANIPPLATHCQLADCQPLGKTWSDKTIEAMKFYVGDEKTKMIVREKTSDVIVVELFNTCPDDIATMLALTGYSTLGYGENVINRLTIPEVKKLYFTYKELQVGDSLRVRLMHGKSLDNFYVAEVKSYRNFLEERLNFTYFSKKEQLQRSEDLKEGQPVAVFMDDDMKYERGVVKTVVIPDKKILVHLVDWGKNVEVSILNIKSMSEKFYYSPALAIYCSIDTEQPLDHKLFKYLYPGYEFVVTVKKLGDKHDCPNIVDISPP